MILQTIRHRVDTGESQMHKCFTTHLEQIFPRKDLSKNVNVNVNADVYDPPGDHVSGNALHLQNITFLMTQLTKAHKT